MTQQLKTTALYCRLSKDDERQGESLSIETQKSMLVRYAQENGLLPYEIYVDDGYSGLNFERPSFQRMIDDVAVGKIGVVVVKDLSRFGRDHIVVGQYQEIYFPSKKVRFIALNDGIDTVNSHTTDYAALKNVINEFYSRDTSRKIKAAFRARAKDGKYHAKAAPFGYLKDPNDHNHLIPDPETAPIVAKIYDLVLKGWGNYRIRDYLRETKVPVPSWYQHIRGVEDKSHMFPDEDSKYIWRPDTLRLLIRNRVYCGDCVLCKSDTIFKTKQHLKTDEKEWITEENTHEAIVSREIWERANELIAVKRREYRKTLTGDLNIFSGLLKCADCGKALSRRKYGSNSWHMIYVCGTYATYGSRKCTQHKIFEEDLTAAMLADIQELFSAVTKNKARLIDLLIKGKAKSEGKTLTTKETQYKRVCKRLEDVNRLIDKLYEDSISGKVNETNFVRLLGKYQQEQESILAEKEKLQGETAAVREICSDAEHFADLLERYGDISELTPEILNMLVEKIVVYEPRAVDGVMRQQLDVYYRYIGVIKLVDYGSTTYYKHGEVMNAAKKREKVKMEKRIAAVKEEVQNDEPVSA